MPIGSLARFERCLQSGVSREVIPVTIYQGLLSVPGLVRSKTAAVDHPPVQLVPMDAFRGNAEMHATLPK